MCVAKSVVVVIIISMCGLMSDVCNNILESWICVIYITVVIIYLFVDHQKEKLHI